MRYSRKELAAGDRHQSRKAVAERLASGCIALGRALLVLAALAVVLLWIFTR